MRKLVAFFVFVFMFSAEGSAQKDSSFGLSFDTAPTIIEKSVAALNSETQGAYVFKDKNSDALKVKITEKPIAQKKESCDISGFKYSIIEGFNVTDLNCSIDTKMKKQGTGSLNVKFKRSDKTYYGLVTVEVPVPAFDARGSKIRLWVRSENKAGASIYISLLDEKGRLCERWKYYEKETNIGNWHYVGNWYYLEIVSGEKSDATHHIPDANYAGDLDNVHSIQIGLSAYSQDVTASFHIDAIEVTTAENVFFKPVKKPETSCQATAPERVYFKPIMKLEGSCSLRPEGKIDGISDRWFDPQIDDSNWAKAPIVKFWDKENDPAAWYRIRFRLPKEDIAKIEGKSTYIVFAGVDESAWVWLNGKKIGSHGENMMEGWNKPFAFDITRHLKLDAENLLAVKVLNRKRAGGIWQPVFIVTENIPKVESVK